VTDAQTGYILDLVTIPALAAVLLFSFAAGTSASAFGGATAASVALGSVYAITLGRGLGLGDVKLAACIGAVLGARDALTALGVAFIAGGIYAGFVLITRRGRRGDAVHFAPYLAGGTLMMSLYGIVR
jgi:prepilin signal peptidase PulO-like enzyme (type II secretory pathway)